MYAAAYYIYNIKDKEPLNTHPNVVFLHSLRFKSNCEKTQIYEINIQKTGFIFGKL